MNSISTSSEVGKVGRAAKNCPLVSIVIITYNSSRYIIETLESCKAQTYKNLELVITDDASPDNTVQLCRQWLNQNGHYFKKYNVIASGKNSGIAGNANRGAFAATGEWLKFLAGDDLLMEDCIEYLVNKVGSFDREVHTYSTPRIHFKIKDGRKVPMKKQDLKRPHFFLDSNTAMDQYNMALRNIEQPSITGTFIRSKVFKDIGGCDERFPMLEDRPLVLKLLKSGYRIDGDEHPTVYYRIHDSSIYHTEKNQVLVNDWKMKYYIPVRREYFLPNYSWPEKMAYEWQFLVYKWVHGSRLNKKTKANSILVESLLKPARIYLNVVKRYWLWNIKKKSEKYSGYTVNGIDS